MNLTDLRPHVPYRLLRDAEFGFGEFKEGDIVFLFTGNTYGCVDSSAGVPMSKMDGVNPFAEIAYDNMELVDDESTTDRN